MYKYASFSSVRRISVGLIPSQHHEFGLGPLHTLIPSLSKNETNLHVHVKFVSLLLLMHTHTHTHTRTHAHTHTHTHQDSCSLEHCSIHKSSFRHRPLPPSWQTSTQASISLQEYSSAALVSAYSFEGSALFGERCAMTFFSLFFPLPPTHSQCLHSAVGWCAQSRPS